MNSADNDIYVMIISVTVVLLILLIFIISFLFIYKHRQVKYNAEMKSLEEKYVHEILKTELEIKEQTLKNISEEIHDNVGQVLSLAVLNLSAVESDDPTKSKKIESVSQMIQKALADLRTLSKTLDSETVASLGLISIIKFDMNLIDRTGVYETSIEVTGDEKRLSNHKELIIYRIIQESLNNIIKHAKASSITLKIDFTDEQVSIEILDDGIGFNIDDTSVSDTSKNGAGIRNMKKRAKLINASFNIFSAPTLGTSISMTVPLE